MALIDAPLQYRDVVATPFFLLTEEHLWEVYRWRNNPRIRRWMVRTSPIEPDEHRQFVEELAGAADRAYLRVDAGGHGLGVIILTQVTADRRCAEIGLYRNPDTEQPGLGGVLMELIEYVAMDLGIQTVQLKVRRDNAAAIRLYQRFGYAVSRTTKDYEYREKQLAGK